MILVVDDDPEFQREATSVLQAAGWEVRTAASGPEAIALLAEEEAEVVLSDVRMPGFDGLELQARCRRLFPSRATPFGFVTSLGETSDVVRGLESGADDYLVKPVPPGLLVARVKAMLRAKRPGPEPVFRGDLSRFPFIQVLRFCELHGLTGSVEFEAPGLRTALQFQAGAISQESDDDDRLAPLYEATEGTFVIRSAPIDFSELAPDDEPSPPPGPAGADEADLPGEPVARLSAIELSGQAFQVHTGYVGFPREAIVSIVLRDGRGLLKRVTGQPPGRGRKELEGLIAAQHAELEEEVGRRFGSASGDRDGGGDEEASLSSVALLSPAPAGAAAGP